MKFCKDCSKFTPNHSGTDGHCANPVSYHLVTGEPQFNGSFRNRITESLCGTRGAWFVPKVQPKPEGPENMWKPSLSPTLAQKLKLLFK
jgi:hypothetical protein